LRDQGRGSEHLEVLLSLAYRLVRCPFGLLAVLSGLICPRTSICSCCATRTRCCAVS
jgi:hypothetical protein